MRYNFTNEPQIYNLKDVNRVSIMLLFPIKTENDNVAKKQMLLRLLSLCSKDYYEPTEFYKKMDSLYILNYSVNQLSYKEITYLSFTLVVPKDGLINEFSLEEALKFFRNALYEPCINNNEFDSYRFGLEKDYLLEKCRDFPKNIYEYVSDRYNTFIDKDESVFISHPTYLKLLKKLNVKDLYKFYKESILNNNYFVYIFGSIKDKKHVSDTFNKVFNKKPVNFSYNVTFNNFEKFDKYVHKEDKTKYNQACLALHYVIKDNKSKERAYYEMLVSILDSKENALVYNALRVDNNLVYSIKFRKFNHFGFFDILVYYNDVSYKKIIEIVNNAINSLYKREVFEECKKKLIRSLNYDLLYLEDDPTGYLFEKIKCDFSDDFTIKRLLKLYSNINYEDFVCYLNKLTLSKSYLFKGGEKDV